jgi:hypothetical protein
MTSDTAVPYPTERVDPSIPGLTDTQTQRAAALEVARAALMSKIGLFGGSNVTSWTVADLLAVADWVLGFEYPSPLQLQAEPMDRGTATQLSEPGEPFDWDAPRAQDDTDTQSIPTYDPVPPESK